MLRRKKILKTEPDNFINVGIVLGLVIDKLRTVY